MVSRTRKVNRVAGIEIVAGKCPKCKSRMFAKPCPCWLRRRGHRRCAKCLRCGHQIGRK